jgi:HSP20 family protein
MSQFPWKPLRLIRNVEQEIDRAFDELIVRPWGPGAAADWQPDIDLYETPELYLIEADVPGAAPESIHVSVDEHAVTISGSRASGTVERSARGVKVERRKGSFSRRFHLEHAVDTDLVEREHREGTLLLKIPKRKNAGG